MEDDVNVMVFRRYKATADSAVALYLGSLRVVKRYQSTTLYR